MRNTKPSSGRSVISGLVEAGEISGTCCFAATDWPAGIVSAEAQAPAKHDAPSETSLFAAWSVACGFVSVSPTVSVTLLSAAGVLERGVRLLDGELRGLLARGREDREITGLRDQGADGQTVERATRATTAVVLSSSSPHAATPSESAVAAPAIARSFLPLIRILLSQLPRLNSSKAGGGRTDSALDRCDPECRAEPEHNPNRRSRCGPFRRRAGVRSCSDRAPDPLLARRRPGATRRSCRPRSRTRSRRCRRFPRRSPPPGRSVSAKVAVVKSPVVSAEISSAPQGSVSLKAIASLERPDPGHERTVLGDARQREVGRPLPRCHRPPAPRPIR